MSTQFVWWRQFGFGELREGRLALWNPHSFCGVPFFGGFQSALLYPPNWTFLCLPLAFALNLSMAFHLFLIGILTFLWVRGRGNRPESSLMAAFLLMFSGAFYVRILEGHLTNLCAMPWIPFILWALDGWKREGKPRWIAGGAIGVAFQVLSGHPQYVYYTALFAFLYLWVPPMGRAGWGKALGGYVAAYGAGALLSAVQLLAGWDASRESVRASKLSIGVLDMLNLTPERLCTLFVPYFYGTWKDYWGGGIYYEANLFMTMTGAVLAVAGWRSSKDPGRKALGLLSLLLVVLMVGRRTPLFPFLCATFPLFGSFRGIGKLNILLVLCLGLLAAGTFDRIVREPEWCGKLVRPLGWGSGSFFLLAALFGLAAHGSGAWLFRQFIGHADGMVLNLLGTGTLLGVLALLSRASPRFPSLKWAWFALVLGECLVFALLHRDRFDLEALRQRTAPIQETYRKDPGDYRVWMDLANYTLGAPSGLDVWGEDPLMLSRYTRFAVRTQDYDLSDQLLTRPFYRRIDPCLGLLRWRYIFHEEEDGLKVRRTGLREAPRAFLVGAYREMDEDEAIGKAAGPGFDPVREVLLEGDPGVPTSQGSVHGEIDVKDLDSDRIEINAMTDRPAILVLTDNYSKGWKASPLSGTGQSAYRVMPANGFQRAIPLAAGSHHFLLEYRPALYVLGKWTSILSWSLFILLSMVFWVFVPRKRGL